MDSFESRMNPRFLAESEKGMLQEPRVIESGRETIEDFKEDKKGKRRASVLSLFSLSWFSVIHVFMSSVHAFSSLVRLVTLLREVDFWRCESSAKSWWFTEWLAIISERGVMYRMKRTGFSTEPWVHELWWWQRQVIYWSGLIPVWEIWLKPLECSKLMPKTEFRQERRFWWSVVLKEQKCCCCPEQRKYHLQHVTKWSQCCILLDRLTERGCWGCFLGDGRDICGEWLFQGFWTGMEG